MRYNDPEEIVGDLLKIYFEFTQSMCNSGENHSFMGGALYTLRSLYEAFAKMQATGAPTVILQVKDAPKAI